MAKYFVFPNHHPWWGEALPGWYRFMPVGDHPNESILEVRVTAPIPSKGPRPAPAQPIDIDFDTRTSDIPELGAIGYILEQDMQNLVEIQKGPESRQIGLRLHDAGT
jgi:hypothetical protein